MPNSGENSKVNAGRFVGPAESKSVVVNLNKSAQGPFVLYRFPAAGYVQKAFLFSEYSTGGTALLPTLKNAGLDGSGTVVLTAATSGTVLAGSAYAFTVDPYGAGPETFKEGELVLISFAGVNNVAVDIQIQLDVVIETQPVSTNAPGSPPSA